MLVQIDESGTETRITCDGFLQRQEVLDLEHASGYGVIASDLSYLKLLGADQVEFDDIAFIYREWATENGVTMDVGAYDECNYIDAPSITVRISDAIEFFSTLSRALPDADTDCENK